MAQKGLATLHMLCSLTYSSLVYFSSASSQCLTQKALSCCQNIDRQWEQKYSRFTAMLPTKAFLAPMDEDEEIEVGLAKGNTVVIKYKALSELQPTGNRCALQGPPRRACMQNPLHVQTAARNDPAVLRDKGAGRPGRPAEEEGPV